jgi:tetratricopeptide (TPR) repeat protein
MHTRPIALRNRRAACALIAAALAAAPLLAQPGEEPDDGAIKLDGQITAAITAPYLKPGEAAALRVKHGVPTAADLSSPAARAIHALQRGCYIDPSLSDPAADPLDRAEAAVARGDFTAAEPLLKDGDSLRTIRLRAQLAFTRGRTDAAIAAARAGVGRLAGGTLTSADDIVDGVLCAAMLARATDTSASGGGDHQAMMSFLAKARELDPFSWRVPLTEAQLLQDKDNYGEARAAATQALTHNPSCSAAYAILGDIAVSSFNLEAARSVADKLDQLAAMAPLGAEPIDIIIAKAPPSLEAALIRVRASLRQNDPKEAAGELAYAAKRMPDAPLVAELACAVAAANYDDSALTSALDAFKARFGDSAAAEARVGQTLSDLRQYGPAVDHLKKARTLAPFWPNPQIDLGLVLVQAARDEEARGTLDAATKLDPFNVRAANTLKLVTEVATYARVETPHFIVRAKPGIDALLAAEVAKGMEENHAIVTSDAPGSLNYSPPQKTFIDLMPDHAWFAVRIAGLPKIHTIAASTGPVIAMEAPREGHGHTGLYDWPRVLRHEYTHTVGLSRTANRMPHWFTEAQAQYLEHAPRDYNTAKLLSEAFQSGELFDFTEINTAFTRPKKPNDRHLAYAQGQWMYEYMVERFGAPAPLTLMDLFTKGVREESAVQQTFHISREQFLTDFKVWAKKQLIEWGMLTPDGEPSLESLIKDLPKPQGGEDPAPTGEDLAGWLKDHPRNPDVLRLLLQTVMDERKGELLDTDLIMFVRYAEVRPVDPFPHQQLARIFLSQNKIEEAIPQLEWLDARETTTAVYATQLAGLYAKQQRWDMASQKAERAARIAPYNAQSRELAATLAVQRKDFPTARRHLTFLAALEPDRDIHTKRLEALKKLEETPAAR